ncbi:1580_t:CDS:2 [Cetraspora pellucida]|uniref:1580_t:CDS:1 n=1 Tax=Cetraspora pellucida TaxID=1433469 RepID=A0ACA9LK10_9GLOM|nr:1580_t:CDS:2 [Cetraspora pellucida]
MVAKHNQEIGERIWSSSSSKHFGSYGGNENFGIYSGSGSSEIAAILGTLCFPPLANFTRDIIDGINSSSQQLKGLPLFIAIFLLVCIQGKDQDKKDYKDKISNSITVFNKPPFSTYKAGDDLMIDTEIVASSSQSAIFDENAISGNITTQQGNSNIGNIAEDNADFSYSADIVSTPENISQPTQEPTNKEQVIEQEEQGLTSTEETKKDKPSWKERKDCQLAFGTLIVTALTGIVVPIVLKVTGKRNQELDRLKAQLAQKEQEAQQNYQVQKNYLELTANLAKSSHICQTNYSSVDNNQAVEIANQSCQQSLG